MRLKSLDECRLRIGKYHTFTCNSTGAGGKSTLIPNEKIIFKLFISFFTSRSWNQSVNGSAKRNYWLEFRRNIIAIQIKVFLCIGGILKFPELIIQTFLKTRKVKSNLHKAKGINLQQSGLTKLVGTSLIQKTGNKILDTLHGLPNEALEELNVSLNNQIKLYISHPNSPDPSYKRVQSFIEVYARFIQKHLQPCLNLLKII